MRVSPLSSGSRWPEIMSSSIDLGLCRQLFLLRRTAMLWLSRVKTVV